MVGDGRTPEHPVVARLGRDVTVGQGARQGAAWIGTAKIAMQVFQFAVSLITARLLLPSQFGEAALVLSICLFAQLFTELGLGACVVQVERVTEELISTAFWIGLASGVVLTAGVAGASGLFARLYGEPDLAGLIALASLNFVLSCGAVPTAILERTFNFRSLAIIESVSTASGIAAVPIGAVIGLGTFSMVAGTLVSTIFLNIGLYAAVRWRPRERPTRAAATFIWRYSRGIVGFNAVNYWSRNLDNLLLGGFASTSALGEYNRSYTITTRPVQQMSTVVGRVLFPSLARLRTDPPRVAQAWARGMSTAGAVTMPVTVLLATTAPALVAVLYGERWLGMTVSLELLALAAMPQIVAVSIGSVFRAMDETGLLFRLGLYGTGLTVLAIVAGLPWGPVGVASALLIRSWLGLWTVLAPMARILQVPVAQLLKPSIGVGWPILALAASTVAIRLLMPESVEPWETLSLQLAVGAWTYLAALWVTRSPILEAVEARLRRRFVKRAH